jgi:hypothetical protein
MIVGRERSQITSRDKPTSPEAAARAIVTALAVITAAVQIAQLHEIDRKQFMSLVRSVWSRAAKGDLSK